MPEWRPFLGPFHSVLLHFPIGFLILTFLLDLYALRRPSREVRKAIMFLMTVSVLSAVVVAILGYWRASAGGYNTRVLLIHRQAALITVGLAFITAIAQRIAFRTPDRWIPGIAYRGLFFATLITLTVTGHYGGSLAHGSTYLVQDAPEFVKEWFGEGQREATAKDAEAQMLADRIMPIMEKYCLRCHGSEKQARGLRLDLRASALHGGVSGTPAIVPGAPLKSELIRRLLLLPDDRNAMPPKGTERPTADEILALAEWIERGAPYADSPRSQ